MKGGKGDDKDDRLYDCSDCTGKQRLTRRCAFWPPPEVDDLREHLAKLAKLDDFEPATQSLEFDDTTPESLRDSIKAAFKAAASTGMDQGLAGIAGGLLEIAHNWAIQQALDVRNGLGRFGRDSSHEQACPLLKITPADDRWLQLYNYCHTVGDGWGGAPMWRAGGVANQDVRMLHAFGVIRAARAQGR